MRIGKIILAITLFSTAPAFSGVLCNEVYELELDVCETQYRLCVSPGPLEEPPDAKQLAACWQQRQDCVALATYRYLCCLGQLPPEFCELLE
jgi:hypothetical protein